MNKLIIILALLISGCAEPMTNQKVIAAVKECTDAGHKSNPRYRGFYPNSVTDIQCSHELLEATQ